ncbi:FecR domain-containing protein [Corallococcus silvisoli]|uniref:FecR domain-containing protein n=1 Tax=Corallococcus silvisoli TaxID=2697031 RepID=UPI0013776E22|nr:FecR domain-containing protein [Corallococcus silvisoli]NBD09074.1 VgrG protein [Corallococcus silvisoli]
MASHETQALWALAAGELDAAGKARVEAHVAACGACAAELGRVVEARALLHAAREVEPAVRWDETGARLKAAAAKRMASPERRFLSPWALTFAGACAAVLVLWLGVSLANRPPRETRAPEAVANGPTSRPPPTPPEGAAPGGPARPAVGGQEEAVAARTEARGEQQVASAEQAGTAPTTEAERATGAVLREATGAEHVLTPGMRLRSGMAVRTQPKASAVLRLPDESRVRLSAGSDVVFARAESNAVHLTVHQGRLSVSASHVKREVFLVESAGLRVSVVGTVFSVERTVRGAAVAVLEGRVRVDADGQPPRFVDAGERVELSGAQGVMKPRTLSAEDRQAFRDLRAAEPGPVVVSLAPLPKAPSRVGTSTAPRQSVGTGANPMEAPSHAPASDAALHPSVATRSPTQDGSTPAPGAEDAASAPEQRDTVAPSETPQAIASSPKPAPPPDRTVAAPPSAPSPADDFVPYPGSTGAALAASSPLPTPGDVRAPSIAPSTPVEPRKRKTLGALVPGGLLSEDSDERFLGYAKVQSSGSTCGRFLVGLGEIAQASPRMSHREQARVLRGRCFTKLHQPSDAEDEFRQYLREFPTGRYATEARTALGMSAEAPPSTPPQPPAPLPAPTPTPPRWNGGTGAPQQVPVSPGVPRRW